MPRWECDSSEELDTTYYLAELLDQFQHLWDKLTPLEPANHPPTHMEELPQLANRMQHLAVALQPCPNPQPKEKPIHTLCRQTSPWQDIPTLDGQDSSKLEDWFMDIETTTDILTRSQICLAEATTCGLTHTLIHGTLQAGKHQDTRISNNNNSLLKQWIQCHLVTFHILKLSSSCSTYSKHFHLPPHYKNNTIVRNISLWLTSQPIIQEIATFQQELDLTPPAEIG